MQSYTSQLKKTGIVFLAFLLVFTGIGVNLGTLISYAANSSVYVASDGNDSTGDGTREAPYATLQKAYLEVDDSGTIYVMDNITMELINNRFFDLDLNKTVTLTTAPGAEETAVIQRGASGGSGTLFNINGGKLILNHIIIDGKFGNSVSLGRILNVSADAALTIEEGTILRNNTSQYIGSAIILMGANAVVDMTGGEIVGNTHVNSGAVYIDAPTATFSMSGGSITGNNGGGVYVAKGNFRLSGDAVITGNMLGTSKLNVFLASANLLTLSGDFAGQAGITAYNRMTAGSQFGVANSDAMPVAGVDNLFPDTGTLVAAYAEGTPNLVWREVVAVDKTQLQAKVGEINGKGLNETEYTEESWQALQDALDAAQVVLDNDDATQVEIDQAFSQLGAARGQLTAIAAPPAAPGGVRDGLISWVDVGKSADITIDGNVTLLNDLAVNEQWTRVDPKKSIPYTAAAVNYNPGIKITQESAYFVKLRLGGTVDTEREVFSVQASENYAGFPWDLGGTGYGKPGASHYGNNKGQSIHTYFGSTVNKTVDVQGAELKKSRVMNIWSSQSEGWSFALDGKTLLEETSGENTVSFGYAAGQAYIGAGHMNRFNGSISEVIVFNKKLDANDRLKVNSYLAVKYGLTLPTDYVDSSGGAMWTQGDSSDYSNRIAGIGRDDQAALYQKQSRSQEVGAHVTMAVGDAVAASNEANLNSIINDRSYIVFGDNGRSTSFVDSIDRADEQLKRTERVYKMKKTNWQDTNLLTDEDTTITLQVDPVEGAVDGPLYVVFSADDQFDAADSFYLIEDGKVTIDTKDFGDVSYFTLAALVPTLETAVLEQPETGGPRIVLTLDQEIGLANLNGFKVTINDTEVDISTVNFEVDPAKQDQLILKLPVGTVVTDNEVKVNYDGTGTLKGTNGVPAAPFEQVAADDFASALQIIEPGSQIVNVSRPAIGGTSVPEATISIVIKNAEGQVVNGAGGTVIAEEDGTWSFTPSIDLAEGTYTIEAKASKDGKTATKTKTMTVVDKTALQSEVDEINNDLEETDYTPDSWQELEQALNNAQQVLDNDEATQEEVDQALEALETARNQLQLITVLSTPVAQLNEQGVLSWDEVNHADTYEVTIEIDGEQPRVIVVDEGTELDLSGLEPALTPGTYSVTVIAKSNSPAYTDSEPSEEVTYEVSEPVVALAKPDAQVNDQGVLSWDEVNHADTYEVTIEIDGEQPRVIVVNEGTELDLSSLEPALVPGTYSVTVVAKSNSPAYTDSDPSEEVTYEVPEPVVALATPEAQVNDQGVLSWDEVNHADTYEVTIEIEGQEPRVIVVEEGTELDLSGLEPALVPGTYSVTVVAKSNNPAYTDSDPSEEVTYEVPVPVVALATPDVQLNEEGVLSWDEVNHADTYEVTIEIEGQEPRVIVVDEGTELDLSGLEPALVPGTYSVTVIAKSNSPAYTDSDPSEEVTYEVPEPVVALAKPDAQVNDQGVLSWDEVNHADTYEVTIEIDGEQPRVIVVEEGTELNLLSLEPALTPGTYKVTVVAKSNSPAYTDSDPSEEVTYEVPVAVDKTALQNKVTEINNELTEEILLEEQYTEESWKALQKALEDAKTVLADPDATQAEVDAALDVLKNARTGLVKSDRITIAPSVGTLNPTATDGVYAITVGHSTSNISFTVTPDDPDVQITVHGQIVENGVASGPIALNVGLNEITIVVKGQDDSTRTYKIQVTREAAPASNPNPIYYPGVPSSPSNVERITVDVEARGKGVVAKTEILRTTNADGTKSDEVAFGATVAEESVRKTLEAGATTVRIVIPDEKDEVKDVRIDLTAAALAVVQKSGLDLEIYTDNGLITIPNDSLIGLNDNLYFHLIPIKQEDERKLVEQRARTEKLVRELLHDGNVYVVDRPFTIETNMPNRKVFITLPMNESNLPTATSERERFLSDLAIFIEHSDGERKVVTPEMGDYAKGKLGLTFGIEKFSTFTILNRDAGGEDKHAAYIIGYPDGTFKPLHALTRAQIAVILHRVLDLQAEGAEVYPDVSSSHWASEAIRYVSGIGLMEGMPDGSFQPDRDITRAEMALIIARLKELTGEASHTFSDVVGGHWAEQGIANVFEAGYMEGMPDGSFQPNKILTRAEAVTVFNRVLGRGPLYGMNQPTWPDVPMDHWAFHQIEEASQDHSYQLRPTGGETILK